MIIKTQIPKQGKINEYIGKPVYDHVQTSSLSEPSQLIGEITNVKELEYNFELTIELKGRMQIAWEDQLGNKIQSIGMKLDNPTK